MFWLLLHITGFAVTMELWERCKVNYRFIFSFNPSTGPIIRPASLTAIAGAGWVLALLSLLLEMLQLLRPCPDFFGDGVGIAPPVLPSVAFFGLIFAAINPLFW